MITSTDSFTDIHSHILPGIDDGAATVEDSLTMARSFISGGVDHVFATPHHIIGTAWALPAEQVMQQVKDLQTVLQQHKIPLTLHPGMEIALHYHLEKEMMDNELLPLGDSNCYLIEPPFQSFRDDLLDVVLAVQNTGKCVILAHPERIPFFQQKTKTLIHLAEQGVMIQVNIGSVLGKFGKKAFKTVEYLAQHNAIHFVASDAHGTDTRHPPTKDEWQQLDQILGSDQRKSACIDNPARLFDDT